MSEALLASLFAFAIQAGGYTEYCKANPCTISAIKIVQDSPHVRKDRNGWYFGGTSYIKDRGQAIREQITTVHELTHHLQHLTGRYHNYRGVCNQYGAEREAHLVGEAYAQSIGWTTNPDAIIARYRSKCDAAVNAGLIKRPVWMEAQ